MTDSLVSIIVPCFNSETTIRETLWNCLQQTHANIEVLVVDDQSTDGTPSIVLEMAKNDSRVILVANGTKGVQNARNLGLDHAKGEFIKFLDSDDLMDLDLIEKQVQLIRDSPASVVNSRWAKFSDNLDECSPECQACDKAYPNPANFLTALWNGNMYPLHAWLVPTSLLGQDLKWNRDLVQNQDGEFFARVVARARDVKHCTSMAYYRQPVVGNGHISQRTGADAITSQIKTLHTYRSIADQCQPHLAILRAYNQQVFNVAYRATNSVSEGTFLEEILNLMVDQKTSQVTISSLPLRIVAKTLGIRKSLQIRRWIRRGL